MSERQPKGDGSFCGGDLSFRAIFGLFFWSWVESFEVDMRLDGVEICELRLKSQSWSGLSTRSSPFWGYAK